MQVRRPCLAKGRGEGDLSDVRRQPVVRGARACVCSARRKRHTSERWLAFANNLIDIEFPMRNKHTASLF